MVQSNLSKYLVKLIHEEPFFSHILMSFTKIETDQIPTAGVTSIDDNLTLYWNPKFLETLSTTQIMGLLKHECYHIIFNHCTSRKQKPHMLWNMATDLAINSIIPEHELPEGGLIPGKALDMSKVPDEHREEYTAVSNFIKSLPKNQASEWYMHKLKNSKELKEAMKSMEGKEGEGEGENSGEGGSGKGKPQFPGFDDHEGWGDISDEQKQQLEGKIKKVLKDAVKKADRQNGWGSVSGNTRELLRSMCENTVDWKKVLQNFVGRRLRSNKSRTHRRINRKYPYIHPGTRHNYTSHVAIYIDQSGSVSDAEVEMFFGALSELSRQTTFTVFHFDYAVDPEGYLWKKGSKTQKATRTMYGGTSFNAVETHFREVKDNFDGYVVLTDGGAGKPQKCIKRRCWVLLPKTNLAFKQDPVDVVIEMKK